MSLPSFLEPEGYRRIALSRNGVGHFEVLGILCGEVTRILVDTGAASTVVNVSVAQNRSAHVFKSLTSNSYR